MPFVPRRVVFEEAALNYDIAKNMWTQFSSNPKIEVEVMKDKQRIKGIKGSSIAETHKEAKRTLVVGIRKTLKFQSCKPSAHYQLPLVTGCTGRCEYCYLNTQFGNNPYIRVYVNVDEILQQAADYMAHRQPEVTVFEGAAVSDPVPVEPYTGSLARAIRFFASHEYGKFRFVTKFTEVDTLLNLEHRQKTTVRFSINAEHVIRTHEHATPSLKQRIQAANKVAQAEYPLGFIIGPVIIFAGWEQEYSRMLEELQQVLQKRQVEFEVISHRFTSRAKNTINRIYPDSTLPMDEGDRKYKYGQFGYGKYVYPADEMQSINSFFTQKTRTMFPESSTKYII